MLLVFYLFINTTSSVEDRSCSDSTNLYSFDPAFPPCMRKQEMHASLLLVQLSMDFQGTQVPLKWQGSAEAVTKTSNNAHVQRRLKPAVLVLQTANQLENSQPLPHLHHPKKKSTSFWCQPLPFPREVSSNCWEPQVTG